MVPFEWNRALDEAWVYLILLAGVYLIYILKNYIRTVIFVLRLQGPKAVPIFGNANAVLDNNLMHTLGYEIQKYGPIFRIWLTIVPYVVLLEPEHIQLVLASTKHTRKIILYKLLDNFVGKGLITTNVETWNIHRRILQPAFHIHMLDKFTETFAKYADILANNFLEKCGKDIDITSFVNNTVYSILTEAVLGISSNSSVTDEVVDDMPFRKGQVMALYRLIRPWFLIDWIYQWTQAGKLEQKQQQDLSATCRKLIKEKRQFLQAKKLSTSKERNIATKISLLEYMMKMNGKYPYFSDEDIIEECCTFMLAGQESVGTATAMTLFLLANHPGCQDKCVEELNEIFGGNSRPPSMKDLKDMKYLEMCIKESLRLYPSVPLFARTLGEDVKIGKYIIPAGCGVFIVPYCTHRLPHHFSDPEIFKPERFSPQNSDKRHPYAYLPFSAGPRNCIGNRFAVLEIKAIISAILRKCRLKPVIGKEEVRPKFRMTVRAAGGLWVNITKRNETNNFHL